MNKLRLIIFLLYLPVSTVSSESLSENRSQLNQIQSESLPENPSTLDQAQATTLNPSQNDGIEFATLDPNQNDVGGILPYGVIVRKTCWHNLSKENRLIFIIIGACFGTTIPFIVGVSLIGTTKVVSTLANITR